MPQRITCPHCRAVLRVPDGLTASEFTCPRCLGRVPSEERAAATQPVPVLEAVTSERPNRPDREWIAAGPRRHPAADFDARRDTRGIGCGLIMLAILAVLGALGLGPALAGNLKAPIAIPVMTLAFVGLVVAALVMVRRPNDPGLRTAGWVVLTLFGAVGGFVLAIVGFVIVVFLVCLAQGGPSFH